MSREYPEPINVEIKAEDVKDILINSIQSSEITDLGKRTIISNPIDLMMLECFNIKSIIKDN